MRLVLLGAPGSGKGTQAENIKNIFGSAHISTGEIIRDNIKNKTKIGKKVEKIISQGKLVPDQLVIRLVKEILIRTDIKDNFVLDGFPRTIRQAEALDKIIQIDKVIFIDTDDDTTKQRILKRKVCPACGKTYSKSTVCPNCNVKLVSRTDDNEQTINSRFEVFENQTKPLIKYYEQKNILYKVNGNKTVEQVFEQIKCILNEGNI